jgi:hypothetical protein
MEKGRTHLSLLVRDFSYHQGCPAVVEKNKPAEKVVDSLQHLFFCEGRGLGGPS